ncbi:hypothetical protein NA57DRAFT_78914 [Rhizodiscina lignyota]|uniref:Uncharacterized protein n=1 Tax=Rhizodiscina lignyota TaxID=1504668 RepID=A0A9P4M7U1_9PEZI|nr:hypothetical protein NA57DRAFT_78914 [Rhizodiscina lignyota]
MSDNGYSMPDLQHQDFFDWEQYYGYDGSAEAGGALDDVEPGISFGPHCPPNQITQNPPPTALQPKEPDPPVGSDTLTVRAPQWPQHDTTISLHPTPHAWPMILATAPFLSGVVGVEGWNYPKPDLQSPQESLIGISISQFEQEEFRFESGARLISDGSRAHSSEKTPTNEEGLKCSFTVCQDNKITFKRKYELKRHIRTKHSSGESHFLCPVSDCEATTLMPPSNVWRKSVP